MKFLSLRTRIELCFARGILAVMLLTALQSHRAAAAEVGDVFVIALENHNFTQPAHFVNPRRHQPQQLLGNPACPFINSLVTSGDPDVLSAALEKTPEAIERLVQSA